MQEKQPKSSTRGAVELYNHLAAKVNRREALIAAGSFLGGAALTLAATRIDREDAGRTGERERDLQFTTGIDISWPQGTAEHLTHMRKDYVIVGINGGMPTTRNAYLANQLRVASIITQDADVAQTGMLPIQLYLNTANPADYVSPDYEGPEEISTWPTGEDDSIPYNPYASEAVCDGTDNQACMYVYGWHRARESVEDIFAQAASEAGVSDDPTAYTWWLDVETYNSWRENPKAGEVPQESNKAVLEGMVAYLHSHGAGVGLYAARSHWNEIVGDVVDVDSNLYYLPTWLATGVGSEEDAIEKLAEGMEKPFTGGGRLAIIQRVEGESAEDPDALDYNYAIAQPLTS